MKLNSIFAPPLKKKNRIHPMTQYKLITKTELFNAKIEMDRMLFSFCFEFFVI
jgi:hypothetical protein